ncbi:hypothetical protein ACSBR2_037842 [Camellia fascicularis]
MKPLLVFQHLSLIYLHLNSLLMIYLLGRVRLIANFLPQKLKSFLWTALHGKLLTNQICPNCSEVEDMNHLFQTCYKAKDVWLALFGRKWYLDMLQTLGWIGSSLIPEIKKYFSDLINWYTMFVVCLWKIWKNRNSKFFDQLSISSQDSVKYILCYTKETSQAFNMNIVSATPAFKLIMRCLPLAGRIKLNTDGCRKLEGDGGFGGLFRDEAGAWLCGHYGRLSSGTSLEAELWAIYKGLTVLLQRGWKKVIIETDAMQAVKLLEEETEANSPFKGLKEDANIIMQGCECTVQHVFKEGNLCADALATS